jgi:hypothetical protein
MSQRITTPPPAPLSPTPTTRVLFEVADEREAQNEKWGEQNHPDGTGPNLELSGLPGYYGYAPDFADWAKDRCNKEFRQGHGTWEHILTEEWGEVLEESDVVKLRAELIQVAAVAVAWVEAIDRRGAVS